MLTDISEHAEQPAQILPNSDYTRYVIKRVPFDIVIKATPITVLIKRLWIRITNDNDEVKTSIYPSQSEPKLAVAVQHAPHTKKGPKYLIDDESESRRMLRSFLQSVREYRSLSEVAVHRKQTRRIQMVESTSRRKSDDKTMLQHKHQLQSKTLLSEFDKILISINSQHAERLNDMLQDLLKHINPQQFVAQVHPGMRIPRPILVDSDDDVIQDDAGGHDAGSALVFMKDVTAKEPRKKMRPVTRAHEKMRLVFKYDDPLWPTKLSESVKQTQLTFNWQVTWTDVLREIQTEIGPGIVFSWLQDDRKDSADFQRKYFNGLAFEHLPQVVNSEQTLENMRQQAPWQRQSFVRRGIEHYGYVLHVRIEADKPNAKYDDLSEELRAQINEHAASKFVVEQLNPRMSDTEHGEISVPRLNRFEFELKPRQRHSKGEFTPDYKASRTFSGDKKTGDSSRTNPPLSRNTQTPCTTNRRDTEDENHSNQHAGGGGEKKRRGEKERGQGERRSERERETEDKRQRLRGREGGRERERRA
jgi:hypothetical protein